jgi:DEAD/DEAH box helicase domain-containing protein
VPGGTGYLRELMRHPGQLQEVFQKAYDALSVCECRLDERKDGCYVCLLAYRGRHFQGKTSRTAALDLLRPILENWGKLKTTDRLETIRLNRLLESELEASFLEALRRVREGEATRGLSPQVVNGKQGWYLKIPDHGNWLIEPQVELGPEKGISVPSRADFVLYPERPYPGEFPIALFADGYEWHADPVSGKMRTGKDSAQRLAIARSGKYRVWSLTWSDVYERLDKPQPVASPLGGAPGPVFANLLAQLDPDNSAAWLRLYAGSAFDMLLYRLTGGRQAAWDRFAQAVLLHLLQTELRQGAAPDDIRSALHEGTLADGWTAAGAAAQPSGWLYRTIARKDFCAFVSLPLADLQAWKLAEIAATLRLMDDHAAELGATWKGAWREFLRVGNVLQFAPGAVWLTTLGLREGIYGGLLNEAVAPKRQAPSVIDILLADVLDQDARALVFAVYEAGKTLPEPGYEIADAAGEIVAFAELAWIGQAVCVMTAAQTEGADAARQIGWTVLLTEELKDDAQKLLALLVVKEE